MYFSLLMLAIASACIAYTFAHDSKGEGGTRRWHHCMTTVMCL